MKKNFWFLISSVLVLALVIIVPFLFTNKFPSDGALAVYLVSKIIFGLLLAGTVIFCFVKETSNGITLSLSILSGVAQFIPLAQRYLLQSNANSSIVWSVIILVLSLVAYVAFLGLTLASNKKMVKSNHMYEGKEIEIKEESTLAQVGDEKDE